MGRHTLQHAWPSAPTHPPWSPETRRWCHRSQAGTVEGPTQCSSATTPPSWTFLPAPAERRCSTSERKCTASPGRTGRERCCLPWGEGAPPACGRSVQCSCTPAASSWLSRWWRRSCTSPGRTIQRGSSGFLTLVVLSSFQPACTVASPGRWGSSPALRSSCTPCHCGTRWQERHCPHCQVQRQSCCRGTWESCLHWPG